MISKNMTTPEVRRYAGACKVFVTAALLMGACAMGSAQSDAFLPNVPRVASTVPANGDVNPYGVAFIPRTFLTGFGLVHHGDVLVTNYNNNNNLQGTGSTIMRIPANGGKPTVFYQGKSAYGPSTGLGVLQYGFVLSCSLPTTDGTAATAQAGGILVISNQGRLVTTIANATIDGPWDMTVVDNGDLATLFVANALSGTVSRINLAVTERGVTVLNSKVIANGYSHKPDSAALFDAPTGLVYDWTTGMLFVASTDDNLVFGIPHAMTTMTTAGPGRIIYDDPIHLHGALALAAAPNGHLLVTNNDVINSNPNQPSEIVEFTKDGDFVKEIPVDPAQGGSFGMAVELNDDGTATLAAVDDNALTITLWTLPL